MKFGMWTANAPALLLLIPCSCIATDPLLACSQPTPGLLMVCSCSAPGLAHPSEAVFVIISILRLILAPRLPPFMVQDSDIVLATDSRIFENGEYSPYLLNIYCNLKSIYLIWIIYLIWPIRPS